MAKEPAMNWFARSRLSTGRTTNRKIATVPNHVDATISQDQTAGENAVNTELLASIVKKDYQVEPGFDDKTSTQQAPSKATHASEQHGVKDDMTPERDSPSQRYYREEEIRKWQRELSPRDVGEGTKETNIQRVDNGLAAVVRHTEARELKAGQASNNVKGADQITSTQPHDLGSRSKHEGLMSASYGPHDENVGGCEAVNGKGSADEEQYDWRALVTQHIGLPADLSDHTIAEALIEVISRGKHEEQPPATYSILFKINCAQKNPNIEEPVFLEAPSRINGDVNAHLQGQALIKNLDLYIEHQKSLSFIVWRRYNCCADRRCTLGEEEVELGRVATLDDGSFITFEESIQIVSNHFSAALKELFSFDHRKNFYPSFDHGSIFKAPYLWFYRITREVDQMFETTSPGLEEHHGLFFDYIDSTYGADFKAIDELLDNDEISWRYLSFLFTPGDILVNREFTESQAHLLEGWPDKPILRDDDTVLSTEIPASRWIFNGVFQKKFVGVSVSLDRTQLMQGTKIRINCMPVYPLHYAKPEVERGLCARGEEFWKSRFQRYVVYNNSDSNQCADDQDERYMIDIMTYKMMHPDSEVAKMVLSDDLGQSLMKEESLPKNPFVYLLPVFVFGFNIQEKTWVRLRVDRIKDVDWNKNAFKSLVIEEDTKQIIHALVTSQLSSGESTDLIGGKGNGLIMLLHGGPGTGKTLTAESVAEIAERPLYRVTCGDVGTKPEEVEKYLKTVLYLGKVWGCVVLLDEADVFLEQRILSDLQRNALVAVLLRVLEYYEGIMILTSNRVGTFDEAFKSRIQLSLHYSDLTKEQRKQIWINFIDRLINISADEVDDAGIKLCLSELSEVELNGRQIRNAITTARQLALYKGKRSGKRVPVGMEELRHVIKVASRFDQYLLSLGSGISDQRFAREEGLR